MELKGEILNYLKTQRLMSVATYGDEPWIANVYYVHDDDLSLYFVSSNKREHSQAIAQNNKVAVAIADSTQPLGNPQKGLQITGTAQKVTLVEKLEWMFKMWNKLIATQEDDMMFDPKAFLQAGMASIYKITPKRIKFFNTELWPKEQTKVFELNK